MFLRKLELNNFRNISKIDFEFNKNINIFIGNNAQGKTNVLESIYFLAITRSHRTHEALEIHTFGDGSNIKGLSEQGCDIAGQFL